MHYNVKININSSSNIYDCSTRGGGPFLLNTPTVGIFFFFFFFTLGY